MKPWDDWIKNNTNTMNAANVDAASSKRSSDLLERQRLQAELSIIDNEDPYAQFNRSRIQSKIDEINRRIGNILG